MKVCEFCGGQKFIVVGPPKKLCDQCRGTGVICLGPEGLDRYLAKVREALTQAAREGSLMKEGKTWRLITEADVKEFDEWFKTKDSPQT